LSSSFLVLWWPDFFALVRRAADVCPDDTFTSRQGTHALGGLGCALNLRGRGGSGPCLWGQGVWACSRCSRCAGSSIVMGRFFADDRGRRCGLQRADQVPGKSATRACVRVGMDRAFSPSYRFFVRRPGAFAPRLGMRGARPLALFHDEPTGEPLPLPQGWV